MDATAVVSHLHELGFVVTLEQDGIHVAPRNRLTPELRELIRAHRPALRAYLRRRLDLTDITPVALRLGSLVICDDCRHFERDPDPRAEPDGSCLAYVTPTWGRVPFRCSQFTPRPGDDHANR